MFSKAKFNKIVLGVMLGGLLSGCSETAIEPQQEISLAEKSQKLSQTLTDFGYRTGELWRTQNNVLIAQNAPVATFKLNILTMRADFTFSPTVYVTSGSVNVVAAYRVGGQLKTLQTPRTNVPAGQEAEPYIIRRASLPTNIDNNEILFLVTKANANVPFAMVNFRVYRDYTNNPTWYTTTRLDSQLDGTSCVLYIRGKITTLVSAVSVPLNSYVQKKAILNVRDDAGNLTKDLKFARKGMAIVAPAVEPKYFINGHIMYLEEIHSDGTITVKEGNSGGGFTMRRRYPDNRIYQRYYGLNIDGFYHPKL